MREFQFRCAKCDAVWYATKKDLKESRKNRKNILITKLGLFGLHTNKTYRRLNEQVAQMQVASKDYERCSACGSRDVSKNVNN